MKRPSVLILTYDDYCNTGFRFSKCLERLDIDVRMMKGVAHPFGYPEQAEVSNHLKRLVNFLPNKIMAPGISDIANEADVIHFTSSTFVDTGIDLKKKKVIVQHSGTEYRQHSERLNRVFNPIVDKTIVQMPELLGKGAKNEVWISFPVDTDLLQPVYERKCKKLLIGHFPNKTEYKGTKNILQVINKLEKDNKFGKKFRYIGVRENSNIINWKSHLDRLRECDIVIEMCEQKQNNKTYGEWGNTAIEASSLGKIVITNSNNLDLYEREYGPCPLKIANDQRELENVLKDLLSKNRNEIRSLKEDFRTWAVKYHSFQATADRLWNKVYKELI